MTDIFDELDELSPMERRRIEEQDRLRFQERKYQEYLASTTPNMALKCTCQSNDCSLQGWCYVDEKCPNAYRSIGDLWMKKRRDCEKDDVILPRAGGKAKTKKGGTVRKRKQK